MNEFFSGGESEPRPKEKELLECQVEMKNLCDVILESSESSNTRAADIRLDKIEAGDVQQKLAETNAGKELLLTGMDLLTAPVRSDLYPDRTMLAEDQNLKSAHISAWGQEYHSPLSRRGGKPDEGWVRDLEISLYYDSDNGEEIIMQSLVMRTGSQEAGNLPFIIRDITPLATAPEGREAHNQFGRPCMNEEEAHEFVSLARELFTSNYPETS